MRPVDVNTLRGLKWEAAKAVQKLRDFEGTDSGVPESSEALSPKERFDKLWDTVKPLMANTREDELLGFNGRSPIRRIITGEQPQVYALALELMTDRYHERRVDALWRYYGPVLSTGMLGNPGREFEHHEFLSEQEVDDWPDSEDTLHKLADLEWSLKAYQVAGQESAPQS
jgi:hypothetical protein